MKSIYFWKKVLFVLTVCVAPLTLKAQTNKSLDVEIGADLVSSYIWRGAYQTGVSIQPSVSASLGGFTLGAWGSTDFSSSFKEVDWSLAYGVGGLTLGVTDYWWEGQGCKYFDYACSHYMEGNVGYSFGSNFPLSLSWNTMFLFDKDKDSKSSRYYSTYVEAGYGFNVKKVAMEASVGVTPWKGIYAKKFDVMSVALKATKEIMVTENFMIPMFVQAIFAPANNDVFLVLGLTF